MLRLKRKPKRFHSYKEWEEWFISTIRPEECWIAEVTTNALHDEMFPDLTKKWPKYRSNDWIPTAPGL